MKERDALKRPAMPGAGRPKSADPRRFVIRVLVTERERDLIVEAAAKEVLSVSAFAAEACLLAVARGSTR